MTRDADRPVLFDCREFNDAPDPGRPRIGSIVCVSRLRPGDRR